MTTQTISHRFHSFDAYKTGSWYQVSPRPRVSARRAGSSPTSRSSHSRVRSLFSSRIALALLAAVVVFAVMLPTATAFGRRSLVSPKRSSSVESHTVSVVVKPGDTLWSIARTLEPRQDPRETVDELIQARGTANVYAGETITWQQ